MSQDSRLLAVFAHPDDETFRCGGTLALLARRGVRVWVLCATRGEAGSRGNPSLRQPDELEQVCEAELCCACAALDIEPSRFLGYLEMPHLHLVPDEAVTLKVDISVVWEAKLAAIHCHRTQMGSSPILAAPEAKQRLFLRSEYFRLVIARPNSVTTSRFCRNS